MSPSDTERESNYLLPFDAPHTTLEQGGLEQVGGKGLNLAILTRQGFAVPPGFLITTAAYRDFVQQHDLAAWLHTELAATQTDDPDALTALSTRIRAAFRERALPAALTASIRRAYTALGAPPVAVRSSATAEDLPEMSFAGQQDTYLNVQGADALLDSVRECWSSLWTARAIGYRARNGVDHDDVALAVIVQEMVQSAAAGVLFTANPLNGKRGETVIDATLGLGEALVSGLVEPDHYVVETVTGKILHSQIGAKATVIHGKPDGGTATTAQIDGGAKPALADAAIQELTRLGARVAAHYGTPQDMEWAYADGRFYVLQSRPITALYPLPVQTQTADLRVYLSFGAIQGVLAPFTPLGQDTIKTVMAGGARLLGFTATTLENQQILHSAGQRLWADISSIVRNGLGRRFISRMLPIADPAGVEWLEKLFHDPRLAVTGRAPSPATLRRLRPTVLRFLKTAVGSLLWPDKARTTAQAQVDAAIAQARRDARDVHSLADWVQFHRTLCYGIFPLIIPLFIPRILVAYLSLNLLHRLAAWLVPPADTAADITESPTASRLDEQTALELTRGLPHNVTTEMDLALWQLAQTIRQDADAAARFGREDAQQLADAYHAGTLPPSVQRSLDKFLTRYGMRGLAEIDLGRTRWREQPAPLFWTLQSYLKIEDQTLAPDAVFRRGEASSAAAVARLAQAATARWGAPGGILVRGLAYRVRALAGLRETPKLTMITLLDISRATLLEHAEEWLHSAQGETGLAPEDLFHLHLNELSVLAMGAPGDWQQLLQLRRAAYARESRRKPIPRLLLSDGLSMYEGMGAQTGAGVGTGSDDPDTLTGQPVSAGLAEGKVRVVLDPSHANLQPGEILVCPGTDPAWTPLFLVAGGLVM
ncbi:MAG: PEP/pyruvate-binding domain-containing protein, partial [Litorilinea sp.]